MNSIDIIICLILLLMGVPDLCRKLGRPALANAFFVLAGILLAPVLKTDALTMVKQVGEVGFLLVLFEVGLEIQLPSFRELLPSLRYALAWVLLQYPLLLALTHATGFSWSEGLVIAAALTGCSMSMAFWGWKNFPGLDGATRNYTLQIMVALEVLAIIVLTVDSVTIQHGLQWKLLLKLSGMAVTIYLISRFTSHLVKLFQWIVLKTSNWRVHFLVLLVLGICAAGERLGLAAPKTAFFLGIFLSRADFQGKPLEEYIAPISRRFLIPVFFVSLGMMVDFKIFFSYAAGIALCGAFLLIGFREMLHRRWLKTGGPPETYLLFCPNLTMAALAATALLHANRPDAATWVTFCGLFISVISLCLLPRAKAEPPLQPH